MAIGSVGILAAGLQPILLGALQTHGRITEVQLGHAATVELFALGLGAALGPILEQTPLRPIAAAAASLYALANLATLGAHGEEVSLVRGLAGLPGGVLIWVATEVVVRSAQPTRWAGLYFALQTLAQLAVAALIATIAPQSEVAAPLAMAALGVVGVLVARLLPRRFEVLPREPTASGLPPLRGWVVLLAAVLINACIVAGWVYLEPLGTQAKLLPSTVAIATPLSLSVQIVGAGGAMVFASRLPWFKAVLASLVVLIGASFGLAALPAAGGFLFLEAMIGLVWLFILSFLTPLAIEADPTRRTAVLLSAANMIGSATGPLAASMLVGDADARSALLLCGGLGLAAAALIIGLRLSSSPKLAAQTTTV